jgi:NDP-sugar pyrophosphorylase family protein
MTQTNTAIVLAAGQGTRLRPLTDTIPKAMVDIGGQPLLERIVRDLLAAGISRIVFVIGHLGERIETYFGRGSNWGAEFIYLRQQVLNGTGGALLLAEPYVSESFLVVFGDRYFDRGAVRSVMQAEHR